MSSYTYVSDVILADMLSAKSKVTDMKMLVEANAALLKDVGLLDEMAAILYGAVYKEEGKCRTES